MLADMADVNSKGGVQPTEAFSIHRELMSRRADDIDPNVRVRLERARNVSAADYIDMVRQRARLIGLMDARLADLDILALPTTPIVAPTMQEVPPADEFARRNAMLLRNTVIVNFFDLCAISVPIPREGGLPAGLMLVARNGQDNRLFRIAIAVSGFCGISRPSDLSTGVKIRIIPDRLSAEKGHPMKNQFSRKRVTRRTSPRAWAPAFCRHCAVQHRSRPGRGVESWRSPAALRLSGQHRARLPARCRYPAGILKDLGLPSLQIMNADTETNVDVARSRAEKLISEGAQLLVGAFDSGQTTAIAQVAEQKGIPLVINIAAAPPITEQGYKFVFRNFPTGHDLRDAFLNQKEIFQITGSAPKTAVMLHVNDTYGSSIQKGMAAMLPKFDMPYQILQEIAYDPTARDLSVEIAKAKATGAEALLMSAASTMRSCSPVSWSSSAGLRWRCWPSVQDGTRINISRPWASYRMAQSAWCPGTIPTRSSAKLGSRAGEGAPRREHVDQPCLYVRGIVGCCRCLQAGRLSRPEGARRRHSHDQYHQQCQPRPRDHV